MLGDTITLISPDGDVTPSARRRASRPIRSSAIFEVGMSEYDASIIFMPLRGGAALSSTRKAARSRSRSSSTIPTTSTRCGRRSRRRRERPDLHLTDWRQRNQTFFSALQVERNVMFMILTLIVLVAALNIISGLIMLVKDKGRDIAILRTMGATRGAIMRIFLMTGAAIGVVRHARRRRCSASSSASTSNRSASSSPGCPARCCSIRSSISCSQLPAKMDLGETVSVVAHGAGAVVPRDALSGLARRQARSGRSAALRMSMAADHRRAEERRAPLRPGAAQARPS